MMLRIFFDEILIFFQDTKKDKRTLIEAYSAIAKSYINLGDIDQALEHLNQYYKIAKDAKKSNFQVRTKRVMC